MRHVEHDVAEFAEVEHRVGGLYRISFNQDLMVKKLIDDSITQIYENDVGKELLDRLVSLIKIAKEIEEFGYDGVIHLTFNDGAGTSFSGDAYCKAKRNKFSVTSEKRLSTSLNLDFNSNNVVFNTEYGFGVLIPSIRPSLIYDGVYETGGGVLILSGL